MIDNAGKLIDYWNDRFNDYVCIDVRKEDDYDSLFNRYLRNRIDKYSFKYDENVCFCKKTQTGFSVSAVCNNEIVTKEFGYKAKKKFYDYILQYRTIIADGIAFDMDDRIVLRYELIQNLFTSNHTHYFDSELPFSIDDTSVFFTTKFFEVLKRDKTKYNIIIFGSKLLNHFENGITVDDITVKPNITISQYGRWYWSNTLKIQNDIKARNRLWKKFSYYGTIVNIDLVSGEPVILNKLANSNFLKKLIKKRIALKDSGDDEYSVVLKNLINVFIHAVDSPKVACEKFINNNKNYKILEKKLNVDIYDIFQCLHDDLKCYNDQVIDNYTKNMAVIENHRRIVIPYVPILSKKDIIKEHRKYLQGLTHDVIIEMAAEIYKSTDMLPLFTIHDSLSYFSSGGNIDIGIKSAAKKIKMPITVCYINNESGKEQ